MAVVREPGESGALSALPPEEPPPVLGRWGALYALVIGGLLVMIALCALVTRWGASR